MTQRLDLCQREEVSTHSCDRNTIFYSSRALRKAYVALAPELSIFIIMHTSLRS